MTPQRCIEPPKRAAQTLSEDLCRPAPRGLALATTSEYGAGMADRPDQEDPGERSSTSSFRRKLSEGLTGLLDPEGALGNVAGFAQGTKSELVRIFANEVRSFLDNMDSVEMLQRVIAGLVIDIKTEIRFSLDEDGNLKPTIKTRDSSVTGPTAAEATPDSPQGAQATETGESNANDPRPAR